MKRGKVQPSQSLSVEQRIMLPKKEAFNVVLLILPIKKQNIRLRYKVAMVQFIKKKQEHI